MSTQNIRPAKTYDCLEAVHEGMIAARYTFSGAPSDDNFEVHAVLAFLQGDEIKFDREANGYAANALRAVSSRLESGYAGRKAAESFVTLARRNLKNNYQRPVLLRNLVTEEAEISEAVQGLVDNRSLEKHGHYWQISTVGLGALTYLQRALFVASGNTELNLPLPPTPIEYVNPQIRADRLNFLGAFLLDALTSMSPSAPTVRHN